MKLPLNIAEKLLSLQNGAAIPSSQLRHGIIEDMVSDGILYRPGKHRSLIHVMNQDQLHLYLENRFSIKNLDGYVTACKNENITRSELVAVSSDSKLTKVRTFKGFLVNCYTPIQATLNDKPITLNCLNGTFQFIYDFENFVPEKNVTIIGIENPENFYYISQQQYLFENMLPLFVCRYPQNQSKDLIKWLQLIPNNYWHFGDFDFAGIGIYLNEFKKHLGEKARFFVPPNIEKLISLNGNKQRYDKQKLYFDIDLIMEEKLKELIQIIHKYKKGLDQEILISG
ncbi:DUF7281 domain-containing protein [Niabella ginsengisoli]|uniref:DUF7281 domain-containing protein n=1 Tax=Niabella ginsengisoli TaxID=522298 RepID=A0ABS9SFZ4_9BACT|nr:hypothetical protein [Niabella ginsengisoli]MCH5597250.1 hypothetical protein [Niabella ginsengisoli]